MSCFTCSSYVSMDDCIENQTEQSCTEEQNRCGTFALSASGIDGFGKGCFSDIACEEYQVPGYCEQIIISGECEVTCCENSLCN